MLAYAAVEICRKVKWLSWTSDRTQPDKKGGVNLPRLVIQHSPCCCLLFRLFLSPLFLLNFSKRIYRLIKPKHLALVIKYFS